MRETTEISIKWDSSWSPCWSLPGPWRISVWGLRQQGEPWRGSAPLWTTSASFIRCSKGCVCLLGNFSNNFWGFCWEEHVIFNPIFYACGPVSIWTPHAVGLDTRDQFFHVVLPCLMDTAKTKSTWSIWEGCSSSSSWFLARSGVLLRRWARNDAQVYNSYLLFHSNFLPYHHKLSFHDDGKWYIHTSLISIWYRSGLFDGQVMYTVYLNTSNENRLRWWAFCSP